MERDHSPCPVRPLSPRALGLVIDEGCETEGSSDPSPVSSPKRFRETLSVDKATDEHGNKMINQYTILSEIGQGSYAKVKLAYNDASDEPVAIKIMRKSTVSDRYKREVAIMKKLEHVNIVSLYEVIDDARCEQVYLVLEYVENGSLACILPTGRLSTPPMSEKRLKRVLSDTVNGLSYLHANGIVHKDVKPENLLESSDGVIKIADFGVSYFIQSQDGITGNGTPAFSPPETLGLSRDDDRSQIDPCAVDVWALGVTCYALKNGRIPFQFRSLSTMSQAISTTDLFSEPKESLLDDLLKKLLEKNAGERATLAQVGEHPFLTGEGCKKDFALVSVDDSDIRSAVNKVVLIVKVKSMLRKRRLSASRSIVSRSNSISLSSLTGFEPVLPSRASEPPSRPPDEE